MLKRQEHKKNLSVIKSVRPYKFLLVLKAQQVCSISLMRHCVVSDQRHGMNFTFSWAITDFVVNDCNKSRSFYCVASCIRQISHLLHWMRRVSNHAMTVEVAIGTSIMVVICIPRHREVKSVVCHLVHC